MCMSGNYLIENVLNSPFFEKGNLFVFSYVPLGMVYVPLPYAICHFREVPRLTCTVVKGLCTVGYGFCILVFYVLLLVGFVFLHTSFVVLVNDFVLLLKKVVLLQGDNYGL